VRGRVAGVLFRPRVTMAEICARPTWAPGWLLMLVVWAACGTWLISTPVGQQALVDERVRIVEAFGGTLDEAEYASLLARPPWQMYFTSGGRLLLTPPVTLLAALALWLAARVSPAYARGVSRVSSGEAWPRRPGGREGTDDTNGRDAEATHRLPSYSQALAVTVHASAVLALGQVIATPLHFVRESLTSPLNLAAVLPFMNEGTFPARLFGAIDLFAAGASAMTRRPAFPFLGRALMFYAGIAAVLAVVQGMSGGS
jgi:Yip1 domain